MLKITFEKRDNSVQFSCLSIGDMFVYMEQVFVKTRTLLDASEDYTFNSISLSNGEMEYFSNDSYVTHADVELIVKR